MHSHKSTFISTFHPLNSHQLISAEVISIRMSYACLMRLLEAQAYQRDRCKTGLELHAMFSPEFCATGMSAAGSQHLTELLEKKWAPARYPAPRETSTVFTKVWVLCQIQTLLHDTWLEGRKEELRAMAPRGTFRFLYSLKQKPKISHVNLLAC